MAGQDPERPETLEELEVVSEESLTVDDMEGSMKDQLANLLAQQTSQLGELHQRMDGSDKVTDELSQRVNALATELSQVSDQCKQLQV